MAEAKMVSAAIGFVALAGARRLQLTGALRHIFIAMVSILSRVQ
jgi:hypothetical protein